MSNSNFAAGFLSSFGDTILAKQKQDQDQAAEQRKSAMEAATLLIQSGRVRDFQSIAPLFEVAFADPSKKGGKKGQQDVQGMLQKMLSPVLNGGQSQSPQSPQSPQPSTDANGRPTFAPGVVQPVQGPKDLTGSGSPSQGTSAGQGQPPPPSSMFLSNDEMVAQDAAAKGAEGFATTSAGLDAKVAMARRMVASGSAPDLQTALEYVGMKTPTPKPPGVKVVEDKNSPTGYSYEARDPYTGQLAWSAPGAPAPASANASPLTGDARQLSDAGWLAEGKDPKTHQTIQDPDARAHAMETGKKTLALETSKAAGVQARTVTAQQNATVIGDTPFSDWAASPDPPDPQTRYKIDPSTGRTPVGIYQDALTHAMTGAMPSLGLGSASQVRAQRDAILNKSAALADAAGTTEAQLKQAYQGLGVAGRNQITRYTANVAAATSSADQMDLLRTAAAKLPRTDSKLVNAIGQYFQGNLSAAANLSEAELYVYTAARDYAKVSSGSAASVQGLTDSATKAADRLLSVSQSPAAMNATIRAMKREMQTALTDQQREVNTVNQTIGSFLNLTTKPLNIGGPVPDLGGGPGGGSAARGAGTSAPAPAVTMPARPTMPGTVYAGPLKTMSDGRLMGQWPDGTVVELVKFGNGYRVK